MRAFLILSFFVFNCFASLGQQIGFTGGYCTNDFYDFYKDDGHFRSEYEQGSGYGLTINLDNVMLDTFLFRFSLNFTKYDGSFMTTDGGLGGSRTTNADVEKYILGVAIFPINIKIVKELKINIGGEFNYLIHANVTGTQSSWQMGTTGKNVKLEDGTVDLFEEFNFGIISRIGYSIKIYKKWYLVPEYDFYWGLTHEFSNIESNVKSYRHYFMLGVANRLY